MIICSAFAQNLAVENRQVFHEDTKISKKDVGNTSHIFDTSYLLDITTLLMSIKSIILN